MTTAHIRKRQQELADYYNDLGTKVCFAACVIVTVAWVSFIWAVIT